MNNLTDNQLAQLFLEFQSDFRKKQKEGSGAVEITQNLGEKLYWSLQHGHLQELHPAEKHKAYQVLDTVIQSMPAYRNLPKTERRIEIPTTYKEVNHHHYHRDYYCGHSDPWLNWMILSNLSRPTYTYNYNYGGSYDNHHHGREKEKKDGDPLAQLVLLLILAALALSAFVLAFYALRELIDCGDRILHNEGMMRALVSLSMMAAAGFAGGFIGSVMLAGPLTALAIAAGISPIGVTIIATSALAVIGAGTVGLLFSQFKVQELFIRDKNKEAMDPAEPQRFSLTNEQENKLTRMGLDIIKVKCAMVAIRNEMGADHVQDKLWRMFTDEGEKQQQLLEKLRQLKDGKFTREITVGDMTIDLRAPVRTADNPYYYYYQVPVGEVAEQPRPFVIAPSAPPMENPNSFYNGANGVTNDLPPSHPAWENRQGPLYPDLGNLYPEYQ
jgi:hypothetical protein